MTRSFFKNFIKGVPVLYKLAHHFLMYLTSVRRYRVARKYLSGKGVEIGALHNPLKVGSNTRVEYVDRLTRDELCAEYPEIREFHERFVHVDIVDDGETLSSIADGSLDFVVANHMLEHCENPLGTLRNHLRKLREGGVLFYAIPDKTRTFDRDRPLTSFDHLVKDDRDGSQSSRSGHYFEFVRCAAPYTWLRESVKNEADALAEAKRLMASAFSIHFHVWDAASFADFLCLAMAYLENRFKVICVTRNGGEIIVVLEKVGAGT